MTEKKSGQDGREDIYVGGLSTLAAANAAWSDSASKQMGSLVEEFASRSEHIQRVVGTNQTIPVKGGFVAEEMHTETFNANAILQGKAVRALTDNDAAWRDHGLITNDPLADIVTVENGRVVDTSQVKYYQDSQHTANAMRETRGGKPYYGEVDSLVGPSDQVNPADGSPSIADIADKSRLRNQDARPHVSEAAGNVADKVTDRVKSSDGVESRPTTLREASDVAKDGDSGKELRNGYQGDYQTASTLQQMQKAAAGGAAISAIISGTLNTAHYLRLVKEGKISKEEAIKCIIKNTAVASADSALKAAAAAGAVSTVTRISAESVAQQAVGGMLAARVVGGAAICAVDAIECMVLVAMGKMTPAQMETRVGKNMFQTGGAVWGSSIGISVVTSLGASAGIATILGGMAGGSLLVLPLRWQSIIT